MQSPVGDRVIVIGTSNAGKTTLGIHLSERLSVPFIDLDALHWEPGWVEADDDVFRERVRVAISTDSWVMAGNYLSQQQHVSWPVADTIVWLDLHLTTVLYRCIRRTWRRWRTRELLYNNNRENILEQLKIWDTQNSLVGFIVTTHHRRRRLIEVGMDDPTWSHIRFVRLRTGNEIDSWLQTIPRRPASPTMANVQPLTEPRA